MVTPRSGIALSGRLVYLAVALLGVTFHTGQARAWDLTEIGSFGGSNGQTPYAGVTLDSQGDLYGTTLYGGAYGGGTVWEIVRGSTTITTIASFNSPLTNNGSGPYGGVVLDTQGNLYGTTAFGGYNGYGTVWEIVKGSHTVSTLATFNYVNGQHPMAGVMLDAGGNLYGTTANGGANNGGTVWEISKGSGAITTLGSLDFVNAKQSDAPVTIDAQGNLYGTTYGSGSGSIWELARGGNTIKILASFDGSNGANPIAGVTMDSAGNLYGTTVAGGSPASVGTVWELANGSHTITKLATFNGSTGEQPAGGVTLDSQGNLFGTSLDLKQA